MSTHLDSLRQALSFSPDNVPLLLLLGEACLDHFLFEEAKKHFQNALALDSKSLGALLGVARAAYLEGNISEAVVRAEALATSHPESGPVWRLLSRLAFIESRFDQARDYYANARNAEPGVRDEGLEKDLGDVRDLPPPRSKPAANLRSAAMSEGPGDEEIFDPNPSKPSPDSPSSTLDLDLPLELERPKVKFDDVGGMSSVKEEIRMKIIYPLKNPDLFRQYGKKIGGGVLLYGPPGCGKTLLSRATAGEIKATFLSIGIHQVLDMWLGKSEKNLHQIFELTRQNTLLEKLSPRVVSRSTP